MTKDKCKKCRRAGEKLFLKGEKCLTSKCPFSRKPYAPGLSPKSRFGKKGKRSGLSEYGAQLRENQKMKFSYGIRGRQFSNYMKEATKKTARGDANVRLFEFLESRLDNVAFRLGLAESRSVARQVVTHGHIMVNDRRVNIPSYRIKKGDKISIRPQSAGKEVFKDLDIKMKKYIPPAWIKFDKIKKEGIIAGAPSAVKI